MKLAAERRGSRPDWCPRWIAVARILREDGNRNESRSLDTTDEGIPGRADTTFEDLAPDKSQPEDAHSAEGKIRLLYPAARTQAERADSLLPGIIAGAGGSFNEVADREKHGSSYPAGQPPEQSPRNGFGRSRSSCCLSG